MSTYNNNESLLGKVVTWFFVALLAIAALKMAFWALGIIVGVGSALLFSVGPIVLVGWLVIKLYRTMTRPRYDSSL